MEFVFYKMRREISINIKKNVEEEGEIGLINKNKTIG